VCIVRDYYESYIAFSDFLFRKAQKSIVLQAAWYLNDLLLEFDCFFMRMRAEGDLRKAFEIMQLLRGRIIRVKMDLGCAKPNIEKI
jgi:hypothetical protein